MFKTNTTSIPKIKDEPLIFYGDESYDGSLPLSAVVDNDQLQLSTNINSSGSFIRNRLPDIVNLKNIWYDDMDKTGEINQFIISNIKQYVCDIIYPVIGWLESIFEQNYEKQLNISDLLQTFKYIRKLPSSSEKCINEDDIKFLIFSITSNASSEIYTFFRKEMYIMGTVNINGITYSADTLWVSFEQYIAKGINMIYQTLVYSIPYLENQLSYYKNIQRCWCDDL